MVGSWLLASVLVLSCSVYHVASQAQAPVLSSPPPPSPPPPFKPPTPKSTACFSGMYNPCGLGTCVNVGTNSYRCICPRGTSNGQRISGSEFCVPDDAGGQTYTTSADDSAYIIAITYRLSIPQLVALNPGLDVNNITEGIVLNVNSPIEVPSSTCWIRYTVTYIDTCSSISKRFQVSQKTLRTINPALDCSQLEGYDNLISICIREGREKSKFYVCRQYIAPTVSFSKGCRLVAKSARRTQLFNPGLFCGRLARSPRLFCRKAIGYQYFPTKSQTCPKGTEYAVTKDDSCNTLFSKFPGSTYSTKVEQFKSYNSDLDCKDRFLFVNQRMCVP